MLLQLLQTQPLLVSVAPGRITASEGGGQQVGGKESRPYKKWSISDPQFLIHRKRTVIYTVHRLEEDQKLTGIPNLCFLEHELSRILTSVTKMGNAGVTRRSHTSLVYVETCANVRYLLTF